MPSEGALDEKYPKTSGVDLVGGYHDAGDNAKFRLPMAFSIMMMSWSIVEYGKQMAASGELINAMDAVKWGTDYIIRAHPQPNDLYGEWLDAVLKKDVPPVFPKVLWWIHEMQGHYFIQFDVLHFSSVQSDWPQSKR